MEPTVETLKAIQNLKRANQESFNVFAGWVAKSMISVALASSDVKDKDEVLRNQGRLHMLKIFNLYLTTVDDLILDHIERNKKSQVAGDMLG